MIDNANLATHLANGILVAHVRCQKIGDFEAAPLKSDIEKVAPLSGWKVIIDMKDVLLMGSSGIGTLVNTKKSCDANKGRLIICGLSDELYGVMKVSALTKLFTIKKDVTEALASF
ncbi:MAG: STAS domain-containing protein [Phycisphaerae bacterium]|nr:STAS domain-containing protein [Phycisphaerae bacterium]